MEVPRSELCTLNGCIVDLECVNSPIKLIKADIKAGQEFTGEAKLLRLPEVVIYQHIDFGGASARTNLNWYYVGDFWNDKISSIIVASGVWRFYEHWHYEGRWWDLGPGYYRWVVDAGIPNDMISSFQVVKFTD